MGQRNGDRLHSMFGFRIIQLVHLVHFLKVVCRCVLQELFTRGRVLGLILIEQSKTFELSMYRVAKLKIIRKQKNHGTLGTASTIDPAGHT